MKVLAGSRAFKNFPDLLQEKRTQPFQIFPSINLKPEAAMNHYHCSWRVALVQFADNKLWNDQVASTGDQLGFNWIFSSHSLFFPFWRGFKNAYYRKISLGGPMRDEREGKIGLLSFWSVRRWVSQLNTGLHKYRPTQYTIALIEAKILPALPHLHLFGHQEVKATDSSNLKKKIVYLKV